MRILGTEPGIEAVAQCGDGLEALEAAQRLRPDVAIVDIRMPRMDGLELTRLLAGPKARVPVKVVAATTFDLDEYAYGALRAGASGFLLKDAGPALRAEAVRAAHSGDQLISPSVTVRLLQHPAPRVAAPQDPELTPREVEVAELVARGLTNAEVGEALFIWLGTVKSQPASTSPATSVTRAGGRSCSCSSGSSRSSPCCSTSGPPSSSSQQRAARAPSAQQLTSSSVVQPDLVDRSGGATPDRAARPRVRATADALARRALVPHRCCARSCTHEVAVRPPALRPADLGPSAVGVPLQPSVRCSSPRPRAAHGRGRSGTPPQPCPYEAPQATVGSPRSVVRAAAHGRVREEEVTECSRPRQIVQEHESACGSQPSMTWGSWAPVPRNGSIG
jgi:DNA-binding NarL/FixJ family response regulator